MTILPLSFCFLMKWIFLASQLLSSELVENTNSCCSLIWWFLQFIVLLCEAGRNLMPLNAEVDSYKTLSKPILKIQKNEAFPNASFHEDVDTKITESLIFLVPSFPFLTRIWFLWQSEWLTRTKTRSLNVNVKNACCRNWLFECLGTLIGSKFLLKVFSKLIFLSCILHKDLPFSRSNS